MSARLAVKTVQGLLVSTSNRIIKPYSNYKMICFMQCVLGIIPGLFMLSQPLPLKINLKVKT